jgi:hypothetical protein
LNIIRPLLRLFLAISKTIKLAKHTEPRMKQPAKLSTMMKLASILSLVALVASPFSASAVNCCTVSGEYFIDDDETDPSSEDIDYAADSLLCSYNASPARPEKPEVAPGPPSP